MSALSPSSDVVLRLFHSLIGVPVAAVVRLEPSQVVFESALGQQQRAFARAGTVYETLMPDAQVFTVFDPLVETGVLGCQSFIAFPIAPLETETYQSWLCGFDTESRTFSSEEIASVRDLLDISHFAINQPADPVNAVIELADTGIWVVDQNLKVSYANTQFATLVGANVEELIGRPLDSFFTPEAMAIAYGFIRTFFPSRSYFSSQTDLLTNAGKSIPVSMTVMIVRNNARLVGALAMIAPISQAHVMQPDVASARFETMVYKSPDVMFVFDRGHAGTFDLKYISAAADQFGWDLSDLNSVFDVIHAEDREAALLELGRVFDDSSEPDRTHTFRIVTKSGESHYLEARAIDLRGDPNVAGVVVNTRDVTERVLRADRLAHLAQHDSLTGLPNRSFLLEQLQASLARAARTGSQILVCYLDLNDFKAVNDRFGHPTGDIVLIQAAERLRQSMRGGDIAGRFGGDEFITVCEIAGGEPFAVEFIQRIQESLNTPYLSALGEIYCPATIGHALSNDTDTPDSLIARADAELYARKRLQGP